MGNIFDRVGWTKEEAADIRREVFESKGRIKEERRDPRICACGHAARAHSTESETEYHVEALRRGSPRCKPSRMLCPCDDFYAVLTSTNIRKFISKTRVTETGRRFHALTQGIEACREGVEAGTIEVSWLPTTRCAVCKSHEGSFVAIAIDKDGYEIDTPSNLNAIVHSAQPCRGTQLKMHG